MTKQTALSTAAAALGLALGCQSSFAQDNMSKLKNFQVTGTDLEMETVDQGGNKAEAIKSAADVK